ncbi:TATA element modulatory factor [Bagarius yarrelli]|uniref:TATA element modulatory factor n=1 Tax=Bagarius yarrelli TaxID=175774 RepID=A0A556V9D9_BAGYA|nr:TATA element modulatory factor [Bagarius yarrelli]
MSWFNASQLSSFAKQALSTAQKSIDRVLDIKEEDQWGDAVTQILDDVKSKPASTGWGINQWDSPSEECPKTLTPSSEAITKPVTRSVVDETESFFSAFLPPGDVQPVKSPVVSVAPTKSYRRQQEKSENETQPAAKDDIDSSTSDLSEQSKAHVAEIQPEEVKPKEDISSLESVQDQTEDVEINKEALDSRPSSQIPQEDMPAEPESVEKVESCNSAETKSPEKDPPKDVVESKDAKTEDRQSDTPSPPVSAFSSGTSTTSDIEVLDHESVLSESSASSRQETAEVKAGLHLMQGSFQLLSASTCSDFSRIDDYPKLTESCGSSSDAFERIDSFSVHSLDSRSVSEVNSDDEIPGSRTLASVTAGTSPLPALPPPQTIQEQEEVEEGVASDCVKDQMEDEMEESGRSATPVNSEHPEELLEEEEEEEEEGQKSGSHLTLFNERTKPEESCDLVTSPITEEQKGASTCQLLELQKIIDDVTGRLEKREAQLLAVSKDKARLEEECDNLRDEMISLKEESSSVQSLKDEFTQRIADTERKAQLACKERDIAKKEIKGLREELSTRFNPTETLELIKEKEEQIRGLLEEGEKLSKQQLQHSNIIKKLRTKEKENETKISKQSKKLKEQEDELKQLQQVLDAKEELEKQHRESIKKLNSAVELQEKELSRLKTENQELYEKNRSLQAALDASYNEAQELALSREVQAKEELSLALNKAQEEARLQQEALANQVADLRLALQRAEQQQARKEDYLREEINELQQRLQGAETRNQELSQSVTSATRPLLRQIENLQSTLGSQTASWERVEKNISDRLAEAQAQLAVAIEKERSATEELNAIKARLASLEAQSSSLRQEKGRLQGLLDVEKTRREKLENDSSRALEEAKKEKLLLTNQLEMEKVKVEQEKKKCYLAQEALKEKDDSPNHSFSSMTLGGSSLYDVARLSGGSNIIENLQSQLKLREGEIAQLQVEILNLERTRSAMAEELVKLTNQNDDLEAKVKDIPRLRVQLKDLEQRHNTILQMYGEKAEEAEELRLDLEDVKNMYKTQIDELLKNQK